MSVLKKVQKMNVFWRTTTVFTVLVILAVPLFILVAHNVKNKMSQLGPIKPSEGLRAFDFGEELENALGGLEIATSSPTSSQEAATTD